MSTLANHYVTIDGVNLSLDIQKFGEWEASQPINTPEDQATFRAAWLGEDTLPRVTFRDGEWGVYTNHLGWDYAFRLSDDRVWVDEENDVLADFRTWDDRNEDAAAYAAILENPAELVAGTSRAFRSLADIRDAQPVTFIIEGFLQEQAITLLAGPSESMKTWSALHITRALLDGEGAFLFDQFRVNARAKRVLYLTPEASDSTLKSRLSTMRMLERNDSRLLISTVNAESPIADLEDPRLLQYVNGADVILDTVVRFNSGDENSSRDVSMFNATMLKLLQKGARTVIGIHHASKGGDNVKELTKDNMLRGSGDYAAVASTVWAQVVTDRERAEVYVKCVKHRDYEEAPKPFVLEGRPHLKDTGSFKMLNRPGTAPEYRAVKQAQNGSKGGAPKKVIDDETGIDVLRLHRAGKTNREIERDTGVDRRKVAQVIRTAADNRERAINGDPGPVFRSN